MATGATKGNSIVKAAAGGRTAQALPGSTAGVAEAMPAEPARWIDLAAVSAVRSHWTQRVWRDPITKLTGKACWGL